MGFNTSIPCQSFVICLLESNTNLRYNIQDKEGMT